MKDSDNIFIKALLNKGVKMPCSKCTYFSYVVIGETNINIGQGKGGFNTESKIYKKKIVPVVVLACENCGSITYHSRVALGLEDEEDYD